VCHYVHMCVVLVCVFDTAEEYLVDSRLVANVVISYLDGVKL
jgi:hypothetical protein